MAVRIVLVGTNSVISKTSLSQVEPISLDPVFQSFIISISNCFSFPLGVQVNQSGKYRSIRHISGNFKGFSSHLLFLVPGYHWQGFHMIRNATHCKPSHQIVVRCLYQAAAILKNLYPVRQCKVWNRETTSW